VVQSITEVNRAHHPNGYVQQWNLSVERELPAGFLLSAAYVGSMGTHLEQYSQQINQISDTLLAEAAAQFAVGGRPAVTLSPIHQRGAGWTRIVFKHLSLFADHGSKALCRGGLAIGGLHQFQAD
jgi:hypothetical protein